MTPKVLAVDRLTVKLCGAEALIDVSLSLERGMCLGIVGESGSGKTLTCRTLLGLERRIGARIVRGRIAIEGEDVAGFDDAAWQRLRGRRVALVPQASLSSLDPLMRIGPQLTETIRALDPSVDPSTRALDLLQQVEMPDPRRVLRSRAHELSGGMRQRAMIALALAGRPSVLIADEPTTALDSTIQHRILTLLSTLCKQADMAMILVSHDLAAVQTICDHLVVMYAGRTVESGPTADIFARPAHPYTRALMAARPANVDRARPLAILRGVPPRLGERSPGCPFLPRCSFAIAECAEPVQRRDFDDEHTVECIRAGATP